MVDRVDAVDISRPMLDLGRRSPGGDRPNRDWLHADAEEAPLRPPDAPITAGAGLHWMEWDVVRPRFRRALTARGTLAIVGQESPPAPWVDGLRRLIDRCSTNRHNRPYDLFAELSARDLFRRAGEWRTAPVAFSQTVAEDVESFHAQNGFSRERMGPERAAAFDAAATAVVGGHRPSGRIALDVVGVVTWSTPGSG